MNQTPFNLNQLTYLINGVFQRVGVFRSIKDERSRVPAILRTAFYLIQAAQGLLSLSVTDELSPTQIVGVEELSRRNQRIFKEIRLTITQKEYNDAIEIFRICGNSKEIDPVIWSLFDSQLDINTVLDLTNTITYYHYSLHFDQNIKNACLVIRKMMINMLYQAADQIENSPSAQSPRSFDDKINAKKTKMILEKTNNLVNELLGDADINALVDLVDIELKKALRI